MGDDALLFDILLEAGPRVISFVGAGGKSGLMMSLARGICERTGPASVMVTTTTHMSKDDLPTDFQLVKPKGNDVTVEGLGDGWTGGKVIVVTAAGEDDRRLRGIDPEMVERLAAPGRTVLVEADGARRLPVKRLRDHEPVIPKGPLPALVCMIVGSDALGRHLDEDSCFNHRGVVADGIARTGDIIDPGMVRAIMLRTRGYADVVPEGHEAVAIVNAKDEDVNGTGPLDLARHLYHPRFAKVLVSTRLPNARCRVVDNRDDKVFGLILAAGESKRFGRNKLLEKVDGRSLLETIVRRALGVPGLEKVVLVLGHQSEMIKEGLGDLSMERRLVVVDNPDYQEGMSTSMRAGLLSAEALRCDAVCIMLADMPNIDERIIGMVLERYRRTCARICLPLIGDRRGHPVIIRKDLFEALNKVTGNVGARDVVMENPEWVAEVHIVDEIGDPEWCERTQRDLDHPTDLERKEDVRRDPVE